MQINKGSILEIITSNNERYTAKAAADFDTEGRILAPVIITGEEQQVFFSVQGITYNVIRPGRWRLPTKSHIRFKRLRTKKP